MKKAGKISVSALVSATLIMVMSLSVFAATTSFVGYLPTHKKDLEISKVRKESTSSSFTIELTSIEHNISQVCVWTEGDTTGYNYSSPSNQAGIGTTTIRYSHVPSIGEVVVLNMDCPVDVDYTVKVEGSWSPN